jgi:hypothetical protein
MAEEIGYRISEEAVDWIEDLDSRVEIASTAAKDVKGLLRVRAQRLHRWLSNRRPRAGDVAYRGQFSEGETPEVGGVLGESPAGKRGDVRGATSPVGLDRAPLPYSDDS